MVDTLVTGIALFVESVFPGIGMVVTGATDPFVALTPTVCPADAETVVSVVDVVVVEFTPRDDVVATAGVVVVDDDVAVVVDVDTDCVADGIATGDVVDAADAFAVEATPNVRLSSAAA